MATYRIGHLFLKILIWGLLLGQSKPAFATEGVQDKQHARPVSITSVPVPLKHGSSVQVDYVCSQSDIVGVSLVIDTDLHQGREVFRGTWRCSTHQLYLPLRRRVLLELPPKLRYKPSQWNKISVSIDNSSLLAFMMSPREYADFKIRKDFKHMDSSVYKIDVKIADPYARDEAPVLVCMSLLGEILLSKKNYSPQCEAEVEVFYGVKYPVMLPGGTMGVHRQLPIFKSKHLRKLHKDGNDPIFTISIWVYFIEYCPRSKYSCSILQRLSWNDYFFTPLIYIDKKGVLTITTVTPKGGSITIEVPITIPKHEWLHMVLSFKDNKWMFEVAYGEEHYQYKHSLTEEERPWYGDNYHLHIFGGSEMVNSFKGIIGEAIIYRGKYKPMASLKPPPKDHPMFSLGLKMRWEHCQAYKGWVTYKDGWEQRRQLRIKNRLMKVMCQSLAQIWRNYIPKPKICQDFEAPRPNGYKYISRQIREWGVNVTTADARTVGERIFIKVEMLMEKKDLQDILPKAMEMLKVASCLGDHDATFMLAAILDQGITMPSKTKMALSYLYMGALEGNRLCLMGLGRKHIYGEDGFPIDLEQAYSYYQQVAARTQNDHNSKSEKQVEPSIVRLIDPFTVEDHTELDGDLIQWYRHWAHKGDLYAQKELASILYWGRKGIERDMVAAAEYYRMAADSGDAAALYDYGIVVLKGHGVKNNTAKAVELLKEATNKGWTPAMNTLGWHAMNNLKDYSMALEYFKQAADAGNPDAAYNIGHMYLHGKLPTGPDKYNAFTYFAQSARRNQKDGGVLVAMYNIRGHPMCGRSVERALMWAQDIAEQNPAVTYLLTKGVMSYRNNQWGASLMYYAMAALTGTELGNFNLAYLCEENFEEVSDLMEQECMWTNYNLTVQRKDHKIHSYSWIKMGDCYWYGHTGPRDFSMAARMYANAAYRGDPQGIFNLALLVEENVSHPALHEVWHKMKIPDHYWKENITLLIELFSRCQEANDADGYLACTMAYYKVSLQYFWLQYSIYIKMLMLCLVLGILFFIIQWCNKRNRVTNIGLRNI